jgi:hypothetical protein
MTFKTRLVPFRGLKGMVLRQVSQGEAESIIVGRYPHIQSGGLLLKHSGRIGEVG